MIMLSKRTAPKTILPPPIADFQYRQTLSIQMPAAEELAEAAEVHEVRMTEEALRTRIAGERAAAVAETEARLRHEYEQRAKEETARVSKAIANFEVMRKDYFARVEGEVVQLALSIAGKILHREAQVDPLLIAAVVQIALGQLKEGAAATIRVRPEEAKMWRQHFAAQSLVQAVSVVEDTDLQPHDCILETELGSANFSLDVQLKEVEKGFFDVLAQRPQA
jgi:flagellar assembly protein FliH